MEHYEQRIVNGILKSNLASDPEAALRLLNRDIEVIVSPERATQRDLWPALWALCSVLERQFTGNVYINAGLEGPLEQPARLSRRCIFGKPEGSALLKIALGCDIAREREHAIIGDARGNRVAYGKLLAGQGAATPVSCFALAGYLGFAALAETLQIPPHREDLALTKLELPGPETAPASSEAGLTFWGLGHLGNAYLSLLFFQHLNCRSQGTIVLLDGGNLEDGNWHTHILVEEDSKWLGESKAAYLADRLKSWGLTPIHDQLTLDWGWTRPSLHPELVLMGFDNFPARRMTAAAGYSWLVEAGIGDSFIEPKLTWHSIPADTELANRLFPDRENAPDPTPGGRFAETLRAKSGCGHLHYGQIHASAPSMGLIASAFVWSELLRVTKQPQETISGAAALWSPILPYFREQLSPKSRQDCWDRNSCSVPNA